MRSQVQNSNPKAITLKQYITSNNLRMKLRSRSNSRDLKSSTLEKPKVPKLNPMASTTKLTREELLNEIKLNLRKVVGNDEEFVNLMRMIQRLTQLYRIEIQETRRSNTILEGFIKQNSQLPNIENRTYLDCSSLPTQDSFLRVTASQASQKAVQKPTATRPSQNEHMSNCRVSEIKANQNTLKVGHNRNFSLDSDEIPEINILIVTRNEEKEDKELGTRETLPENPISHQVIDMSSSRRSISFYQEQSGRGVHSHLKQKDKQSQSGPSPSQTIRFETPSTLRRWTVEKKMEENAAAERRFEEFRRRRAAI